MVARSGKARKPLPNLTESKVQASKRKSTTDTPEPEPKRVNGGSMTVSPHPNDNTPMTKRMRDPNPQALIKFDEPPPRIIYEKLVNPTAMKLFSQARGEKEFQTACTIFWAASSVYIRHVPDASLRQLWSSHVWPLAAQGEVKLEAAPYWDIFKREHDSMAGEFIQQMNDWATKYVESPAGKAWHQDSIRCKSARKASHVLVEDDLLDLMGKKGIEFGLAEVYDFFPGLRACAETTLMEEPFSTIWLQCDIEAVKSKDANSWFKRLRAVALKLILQMAKNCLGLVIKGGPDFPISVEEMKMLLERVPTPGSEHCDNPDVKPPPLPICEPEIGILHEHLEEYLDPLPTATETTIEEANGRMQEILDGRALPDETVVRTVATATANDQALTTAMQEAAAQDLRTAARQLFIGHDPTAKMYAQEIDLTDLAYIYGSLRTKVSICLAQAQDAQKRWRVLQGMLVARIKYWDETVSALQMEQTNIESFEATAGDMKALLVERAARVDQELVMANRLDGGKNNTKRIESDLRRSLDNNIQFKPPRSFTDSTPLASPGVESSYPSARSSGNGVRLPSTAVSSKLSEAKPERVLNDDEELNDVLPGDTSAIEFSEDFGDLQMTDA